jgi:hypothetical protein
VVGVGVVDAGRADLVEPLAVPGHRVGQVDDVEDLGAAEAGVICPARTPMRVGPVPVPLCWPGDQVWGRVSRWWV